MKHALITGASRGIGRACALKIAALGYHCLLNYLSNEEEARKTLDTIKQQGGSGELLPFDVADKASTEAALNNWISNHPNEYVSVLVNNAGVRRDNLLFWMSDEEWESVLNASLNGAFYTSRLLVKYMLNKKWGRIINIVSMSGLKGMAGQTNYSAAKAGVIGLTKALALEAAKKKVTVNAIAPGFIDTDMTRNLDQDELKRLIPLGRFGRPEEVAGAVGFLISEDAAYITGEVINVSGGL